MFVKRVLLLGIDKISACALYGVFLRGNLTDLRKEGELGKDCREIIMRGF